MVCQKERLEVLVTAHAEINTNIAELQTILAN